MFAALVDPLPRLVRAVAPAMIARRSGKVLVVGSASALRGMKRASTYSAARGALVLFLDGDTQLDPAFVPRALAVLHGDPALVAVWGHRRESNPAQSFYTRVLDLDWIYAPGPSEFCGGDALMRREARAE